MNTKRSRAGLANSILIAASLLMASSSRLLPATRNPQEANQAATQTSKSQASNPLVQMLKSPNVDTRAKAARELGKSGDSSVVTPLTEALTDASVKVRREVVIALATLATSNSLDPLVTASRDPDSDVRVLAIDGLVGRYTGKTPSTGFAGFMRKSYSRAKGRFQPEETRVDPGVAVDPKVVSALVAAMQDSRAIQASREAAKGLGVLLARSAVPDLVKAAHSNDEDLSREALNSLSKIKDTSAGPELTDLLDSPNQYVKRDAAVAVGVLRTKGAVPKLQSMYENDSDKKNKEAALEALADIGDPVSDPIFIKALWSNDKRFRALGAEGLGQARDAEAAPELDKALPAEKDANARLAMNYALAALGRPEPLHTLVDTLDSTLRGDTAQTYLIQLSQDPQFLPKLYPYLGDTNATIRRRLCAVLVYTGNQTSLEPLERLSHDKNNDVAVEALRALRAVRARNASS